VNVSLTPELERLVNEKVASGMYGSASEVIRAGLRLLQQQEADQGARLEALRRDVTAGINEADRGQLWNGQEVFDQLRKRRAAQTESATTRGKATRKRKAAS
jgi:antitoxin ParD1/3/4